MTLRTTHRLKRALLKKVDSSYPQVVAVARRNLPRLRSTVSGAVEYAYLDNWENALGDKATLRALIGDESDEGLSAWQVAPFAGVFSPRERWDILRRDGRGNEPV
ncbi:MAG: hypothetical protein LBP28_07760 [Coriobacteriales bacterium]|jgi:hypothetical protein|nr:hypothetical protein [Coriobacteriales bacterium]